MTTDFLFKGKSISELNKSELRDCCDYLVKDHINLACRMARPLQDELDKVKLELQSLRSQVRCLQKTLDTIERVKL